MCSQKEKCVCVGGVVVGGRGCQGWGMIEMGLLGVVVEFDCAENRREEPWGVGGVGLHVHSGKQPLEPIQKLLGNWDVCLLPSTGCDGCAEHC